MTYPREIDKLYESYTYEKCFISGKPIFKDDIRFARFNGWICCVHKRFYNDLAKESL